MAEFKTSEEARKESVDETYKKLKRMIQSATKESIDKNTNIRETLDNRDQIRKDIKTLQKKGTQY